MELFSAARTQETIVAYLLESFGQDVLKKSPDEFLGGDGFVLARIGIAPLDPESNTAIFEVLDAWVGDGDSADIGCQVPDDLPA